MPTLFLGYSRASAHTTRFPMQRIKYQCARCGAPLHTRDTAIFLESIPLRGRLKPTLRRDMTTPLAKARGFNIYSLKNSTTSRRSSSPPMTSTNAMRCQGRIISDIPLVT